MIQVTSSTGNVYRFARRDDPDRRWFARHSSLPPLNFIEFEINEECEEPALAHADFIDSFLLKYPTEVGPKIEEIVQGCATEMDENCKWTDVSIYLPANIEPSLRWSMQYSFESDSYSSFGIFVDLKGDEIINVMGAD